MKKLIFACVAFGVCASNAQWAKSFKGAEAEPGEVLVKFKPGKKGLWLNKNTRWSVKEEISVSFGELALVEIDQNKITVLKNLNSDPMIEYAEPNFIYKAIGSAYRNTPMDPKFGDLWGLENTGENEPAGNRGNSSPKGVAGADINALAAWDITKGSKQIKVAVIDTGVDYNHPDLRNNMWVNQAELNGKTGVDDDGNGYVDDIHGYDFANNDGDPMDGNGHGTHVSGTIAAEHDNGIGVAGVMAQAQIVAVKFLSDQGSGSTADAIKAVDYATKLNVDIMSNSWGGGGASQALEEAIQKAKEAGIVFTAAAGNSATDNNSSPHYPSNYNIENVISVAAHTYNDTLADFSCYGSRTVHVAAPGQNILSTTPNGAYEVYSGTSMATPHVSGVVGLYIAQHGRTNVKELRDNLMASSVYARSYGKKTIGGGRVDAYNFLNHVVASRPVEPDPNEWVSHPVSFESEHPYKNEERLSKTFGVTGAKHVRVVIKKYDIERNYDFLRVKNSNGEVIEALSGKGEDHVSEHVDGDSLTLEFESDGSVSRWGFEIQEIQYIP